jgi:predicted ATPase
MKEGSVPDRFPFNLPVVRVDYDEVEHVSLTRSFLSNPDSYLKHL